MVRRAGERVTDASTGKSSRMDVNVYGHRPRSSNDLKSRKWDVIEAHVIGRVRYLPILVSTGRYWSALGSAGRYWSILVGTGLYWSVLVGIGRYGSALVSAGRGHMSWIVFGAHFVERVQGPCGGTCLGHMLWYIATTKKWWSML